MMKRMIPVMFILLCVGVSCDTSPRRPSKKPTPAPGEGVRGAGWMGAKKIIAPVLKTPSVADFPWDTVTQAPMKKLPGVPPRWRVTGAVDSQNSFGARMRGQWEAIVLDTQDGNLTVSRISLNGDVVYENANYAKLLRQAEK